jgi:hypothetical protein
MSSNLLVEGPITSFALVTALREQSTSPNAIRTKPSFQEPENTIPQLVFGLVLKVRWGWAKGAEVIEAASAFTELV